MPLLSLWRSNPDAIEQLNLQQIVSNAGNGELKDGSACSDEFRAFLRETRTEKLAIYIEQCLASPLNKGGYILQDLVNELGRRLEYAVENGRYAGVVNQVGFDGLWHVDGQPALIVEVKTTDAYRISLDTLVGYREKLAAHRKCDADASILIVVGREDTGELEAQVRGSRHAWDIRLISAEALLRLVAVKEGAGHLDTDNKIRSILRPAEYTRLDHLVDVVFSASRDIEARVLPDEEQAEAAPLTAATSPKAFQFTPAADIAEARRKIIAGWSRRTRVPLVAKGQALFWSGDHRERAVCTVSKRYPNPGRPYWYAYHPAWRGFLHDGAGGHMLLGCMDLDKAFALPAAALERLLGKLNTTAKPDGKTYWHLHIREDAGGELFLYVPGERAVPLASFAFPVV